MADSIERLIVQLEARQNQLEREMRKASKTTEREFGKMQRQAQTTAKRMETTMAAGAAKVGSALKGMAAGFALGIAGGGLTEFASKVREANRNVADLAAEAKRAGVSFRAFQELSYAAQKNQVSVDALTDGLKELQLRADEFIRTGKGSGAESFQRLGYDAATLAEALKQPDQLFEDIIGKLSKLSTAARIRIADEVFGGSGGEQFVQMLDRGVDGIRAARQEARDLDLVLSDDLADAATQVNDRFITLQKTLSKNVTEAMVKVGDVAFKLADGPLGTLATTLTTLDDKAHALFGFLSHFTLNDELYSLLAGSGSGASTDTGIASIERRLKILNDQRDNLKELGFGTADVEKQIADARARLSHINATSGPNGANGPTITLPAVTVTGTGGGDGAPVNTGGSGARDRASAYERLVQRMAESTANIKAATAAQAALNPLVDDFEFALEKARAKQELLNAAKKSGLEITPELEASIEGLAEGYATASAAAGQLAESQDRVRQRAEEFNSLARDSLGGFVHDLADGKNAADALSDAIGRVADRLIDIALNDLFSPKGGGGGLGAVFGGIGTLFGLPAKGFSWAEGGRISGPGTGTSDSIPARLSDGEFVVNAAATKKNLPLLEAINNDRLGELHKGLHKRLSSTLPHFANGGLVRVPSIPAIPPIPRVPTMPAIASRGGGATPVNINVQIDAKGADREGLMRVEQQVAKLKSELPAHIVQGVRKAQKSNVKF